MSLESLDCPNCGAPLTDTGGRSIVVCAHCGSSIRLNPAPPPFTSPKPPERVYGTPSPTVGEYGRPPSDRPERSPLASVTLGASDVKQVVALLRDQQQLAAIQLYHAKVGGTLGEAKDAIEAIEAGLKDASVPPPPPSAGLNAPDLGDVRELLRLGDREGAIRQYRQLSGAGRREAEAVMDGIDRQAGRAPVAGARPRRRWGSCASIFGLLIVLFVCISGGCGLYLQTKPIYRCSIELVKAEVAEQELFKGPIRAGYLVLSPGFRESSSFDTWRLSAEYFTPVWGLNGVGLAYVNIAANSSGSNSMSARLYTPQGNFALRKWSAIDCPDPD